VPTSVLYCMSWYYLKLRRFEEEEGICQWCGKPIEDKTWHLHHIIPRSRGGTDDPENLMVLHKLCHTCPLIFPLLHKMRASKWNNGVVDLDAPPVVKVVEHQIDMLDILISESDIDLL